MPSSVEIGGPFPAEGILLPCLEEASTLKCPMGGVGIPSAAVLETGFAGLHFGSLVNRYGGPHSSRVYPTKVSEFPRLVKSEAKGFPGCKNRTIPDSILVWGNARGGGMRRSISVSPGNGGAHRNIEIR